MPKVPDAEPEIKIYELKPYKTTVNGDGGTKDEPHNRIPVRSVRTHERQVVRLPKKKAKAKARGLPELCSERDLMGRIRRDIAAMGVVGEENNAMLIFLVYVSRLLDNPGSVVTRGKSGGGKSTLLNRVGRLFPKEVKIETMSMTEAAWFNTTEDHFKNKVFIAGERRHAKDDAARDANKTLRQMLSEKKITYTKSRPKGAREWEADTIEREGPIAYAESTTSKSIFTEDLNRLLQLYVDDSEEQTRRVMEAIGSRYDPDTPIVDTEPIIKRHHEFQNDLQALPKCHVKIPYFKALIALMPAKAEFRRLTQMVFTIIEALVVLHQHRRKKEKGRVMATFTDYEIARELMLPPLQAAVGLGEHHQKAQDLKTVMEKAGMGDKVKFTTPEVKKAMEQAKGGPVNDMAPSRLLNLLVEGKLLDRVSEKSGQTPAVYKWPDVTSEGLETVLLPTVEQLKAWEA